MSITKQRKRENFMDKKLFTVTKIEGDYAYLIAEGESEELFIALALLPSGVDVGTTLLYENFEFSLA